VELLRRGLIYFSYAYDGVQALFLWGIALVAIGSNSHTLNLEMLPGTGKALSYGLFAAGLFGIVSVLLAVKGRLRVLFFIWSLAVVLFRIKGYVFSDYVFEPGELASAVWLGIGALVAVAGAWLQLKTRPAKRKFY
jgi:hypothetical protein